MTSTSPFTPATSNINVAANSIAALGDEVESLMNIVEENGGGGEFTYETSSVERWPFPRFKGADQIGTCSDKNGDVPKGHDGVHTRITKGKNKCGVNFEADPGNAYLSRAGVGGYDTDVETLAAWLQAPRNIIGATLLLGEPGTGKTALIEATATYLDREVTTVVCTPDHTKDSLYLRFMGEGKGDCVSHHHVEDVECEGGCVRSPYTLGPYPYAAKHGHLLYLDEFMLLVDGVKPLIYPLADGRRFLPEGNVDGSALEVHPDFRLVLSSNPMVRGASLPEPVASRCASTTITVETDVDLLVDLGIDSSLIAAWEQLGAQNLWRPQIRELRAANYWLDVSPEQAASAFLPEHCPESERAKVRQIVTNFIPADLRTDGRLVVS